MKIIVLGTSAELALPRLEDGRLKQYPIDRSRDTKDRRTRSSIAIQCKDEGYIVFDAGPDFWEQITKAGIKDKVKYLFITHPHKDHVDGLYNRYAPYLTFAIKAHWEILKSCLVPEFKRKVIEKRVINLQNLKIFPFPVYHGTKGMAVGYKILDEEGASLVYLPDVKNIPRYSRKYLYNLDALIMDGTILEYFNPEASKRNEWHASIQEQTRWAHEYKPKKLYFTHIGHETAPHRELKKIVRKWHDKGSILYDGQVITIGEKELVMEDTLKKLHKDEDVSKLTDQQLLFNHSILHSRHGNLAEDKKIEGWSKEDVVNLHKLIIKEIENREMKHDDQDTLDRASAGLGKELTAFKIREDLDLDSYLKKFGEVAVVPHFVSLVGSSVRGESTGDVDIIIRSDERDPLLELKVSRLFPEKQRDLLHFIYSEVGPDSSYIPLFDLCLKPYPHLEPVLVDEKAPSYKALNIMKPFTPLRAKVGEGKQEFSDIDQMIKLWGADNLDAGVAIEKRGDGFRISIHKKGSKVRINFEDAKGDRSDVLGELTEDVKRLDVDEVILDGEFIEYKDNKPIPRKDLVKWATSADPGDTSGLKVHCFDCLWYNGRDLHTLPWKERQLYLSKALKGRGEHLERVSPILCSTKAQLKAATEKVFDAPGSEGAMLKVVNSDYPLKGSTTLWAKVKSVDAGKKILTEETAPALMEPPHPKLPIEDETRAEDKADKKKVNYREGTTAKHCGTCRYFVKGANACQRVKGTVKSSSVCDLWATKKSREVEKDEQEMYMEIPKGKKRFVYHHHWRGLDEGETKLPEDEIPKTLSLHGDLRLEYDDDLMGWTVFLGEAKANFPKDRLVVLPPEDKLEVVTKAKQSKVWLEVVSKFSPGRVGVTPKTWTQFFTEDSGTWELGVQRFHSHEYFFKGEKMKGRYIVQYALIAKGQRAWLITKPKDQTPYYKTHKLETILKELKKKGRKYLIWAGPGIKSVKYEVKTGKPVKE